MARAAAPAGVENLGDGPQRLRLRFGAASIAVGIAFAVVAVELGAPRSALLALFVPFFLGGTAIAMGFTRTCTALAVRGMRDLGAGQEPVADAAKLRAMRRRGLRVVFVGLVTGSLATALVLASAR